MMQTKDIFFCLLLLVLFLPNLVVAQVGDSFTVRQLYGDDAEAPTIPNPFSVTPVAATQIDVAWGASTDNVVVAGYQLFRNGVQIATTTLLAYSDTGLTASTTYAYYVRAFDVFSNISTSTATVSTSTFALPVTPVGPIASTTSPHSSVLPPRFVSIDIEPGTESARIRFNVVQPVTYILRYGTTDVLTDGFVQSDLFKKEHSTILTDLDPLTKYYYELYATDRFGRERLLEKGNFTTLSRYELPTVPNVSFFTAAASKANILLRWGNPVTDAFAYVRVVRSHYYYPQSPTDGYVVYEGGGESFYDDSALSTYARQYYTIFTYNIDGTPSSGAVAVAVQMTEPGLPGVPSTPSTPAPPVVPGVVATSASPETPSKDFTLTFADITVIQYDTLVPASAELITLETGVDFMVRIPVAMVPASARTVIVTWQHPFDAARQTSYLMKRNEAGTHFEAAAAPMSDTGVYPVHLGVFDMFTNVLGSVSGALELVSPEAPAQVNDDVTYVAVVYVIIGGIIGLLTVLGLWWLLLLFLRIFLGKRR